MNSALDSRPVELLPVERPWRAVTARERALLEAQLRREVQPGHALYAISCRAVFRRDDCDDVCFLIENTSLAERVAVVHLTWSTTPQSAPFPWAQLFPSAAHFMDSDAYQSAVAGFE